MKIGDTIAVRKKLTAADFLLSMDWMSKNPLQSPPPDYEYVTITTPEMLAKYQGEIIGTGQ